MDQIRTKLGSCSWVTLKRDDGELLTVGLLCGKEAVSRYFTEAKQVEST